MQQINTRNDPAICEEVAARLADVRDAWRRIADGPGPASTLPGLPVAGGSPMAA